MVLTGQIPESVGAAPVFKSLMEFACFVLFCLAEAFAVIRPRVAKAWVINLALPQFLMCVCQMLYVRCFQICCMCMWPRLNVA